MRMEMILCLLMFLTFHGHATSAEGGNKVFLLVMDGFRHDYDKLTTNMPNLERISKEGIRGKGLIPPFPSVTWPSMNTLSTGLYPESHGIINNNFFDENGIAFDWTDNVTDPDNSRFFSQEPIWLSNQKQQGTSSVYYWPGYYAFQTKPKYHNKVLTPFGANVTTAPEKIDETFQHLESDPSLNFMVVYVDDPDDIGHEFGPNSEQYKKRLEDLDKNVIGHLLDKLESYPTINLVIVADHGMITIDLNRLYFLSDYLVNGTYFAPPHCSAMCSIKPKGGTTAKELVKRLKPLLETGGMRIFNQEDEQMKFPPHLHYTHHKLIPPILVLPNPGWILYDQKPKIPRNQQRGTHGYDPASCPEMRTIFFARGPAFKKGLTMDPFEDVNIYPLLAHLLGIKGKPNNGSLSVFRNVLVDWNPAVEIDLHGHYSPAVYAAVFAGGLVLSMIILLAFYFTIIHCYIMMCRSGPKYGRLNQRAGLV